MHFAYDTHTVSPIQRRLLLDALAEWDKPFVGSTDEITLRSYQLMFFEVYVKKKQNKYGISFVKTFVVHFSREPFFTVPAAPI